MNFHACRDNGGRLDLSQMGDEILSECERSGNTVEHILECYMAKLDDDALEGCGLDREGIMEQVKNFADTIQLRQFSDDIDFLTISGGFDKSGEKEELTLNLEPGEKVCIVGPTGSGKSRLLADIECLAQRDTPTHRQILINGNFLSPDVRRRLRNGLVAQISQNMNFVLDLSVREFLLLHAESRRCHNPVAILEQVLECANSLSGESFHENTPLTQLSGGQSRALMISDTACLSSSSIVLIDEIENAGINRKKALDLLVRKEKITILSTHDPMLSLMCDKRVVIRNGGIYKVIDTSPEEHDILSGLEQWDFAMNSLRDRLRAGDVVSVDAGIIPDCMRSECFLK
jgi:ABC-type lipoprotein export system ATPase subunit